MPLLLQQDLSRQGPGLLALVVIVVALIAALDIAAKLRSGRRQSGPAEKATEFVRRYHETRTEPFTRAEECALVRTVAGMYGLSDEAVAEIVTKNWPAHRARPT